MMEELTGYQNSEVKEKENAWFIAEETGKYFKILNEATERFNGKLKDIEKMCLYSPEKSEEISSAVGKTIDDMMNVCKEFELATEDKELVREARIQFHQKTNQILSKSYCINRTRTWPQGQQGDYKTLEGLYKHMPLSEGIGYYLDLYMLNLPMAVAVINRIKKLEEIMRDEISARKQPFVLNIACGSCRELMGIAPEIKSSEAKIICIDNDDDALSFALNRLSYTDVSEQIVFRKYNAIRMFDDELNMMEFGKQDIIYSAGLFDYLPDSFLVKMLRAIYNLLNPGGKLIIPFKDADRYRYQEFHWLVDWDGFLQRTEEDFERLLHEAGIPSNALTATREESGIMIFYTATK